MCRLCGCHDSERHRHGQPQLDGDGDLDGRPVARLVHAGGSGGFPRVAAAATPIPVLGRGAVELDASRSGKADAQAARNRSWFERREILALNLISAPGAGKTTLLVRTIRDLRTTQPIYVIEGDQPTARDAERIRETGASTVQLDIDTRCQLDAEMLARGVGTLRPAVGGLVMIENVGNLGCPALVDLGERARIALLSVSEGDDKPLKYPHVFRAAHLMLINKIDLLPYVEFDVEAAISHARQLNPALSVLCVSARTGEGLAAWYAWIEQQQTSGSRSLLA